MLEKDEVMAHLSQTNVFCTCRYLVPFESKQAVRLSIVRIETGFVRLSAKLAVETRKCVLLRCSWFSVVL